MENPRESALDVLIKVDKKEELSHIAISNVLEKYQFSEKRDRAFFTRLVEGTLERQITIDYVIDQFSKTKIRKCKPLIRALLRMGVYQILYMDQVPDSAACMKASSMRTDTLAPVTLPSVILASMNASESGCFMETVIISAPRRPSWATSRVELE